MIYLAAIVSIIACVLILRLVRAMPVALSMFAYARNSMSVLSQRDLDDDAKEQAARAASVRLFVMSADIGWRLMLAVAVPALGLFAAVKAGVLDEKALTAAIFSWPILLLGVIATFLGLWRFK